MATQISSVTQTQHTAPVVTMTVSDIFPDLDIPVEMSAAAYTGERQQLQSITRWMGMTLAKEVFYELKQPTLTALSNQRYKCSQAWWERLIENEVDASFKNSIFCEFRQAFDRAAYKMLTGHDLPQTKDGFQHNALQLLRLATGHGDAALILYRIRYWWPRASVILYGKVWIAKTHKQWAEELGLALRSFRTAYDRLLALGLIETTTAEFNGVSMTHVRPTSETVALFQYSTSGDQA